MPRAPFPRKLPMIFGLWFLRGCANNYLESNNNISLCIKIVIRLIDTIRMLIIIHYHLNVVLIDVSSPLDR